MRKRNQLADLKRLISLPSNDMNRQYLQYIYEDTEGVLVMLFELTRSVLNKLEKENILTLLKYLIEEKEEFHLTIPEWMVAQLNDFIQNQSFSDHEKAAVLSTFDPEQLLRRVAGFERFVQRFMDIKESFEDYVVREIREKRKRLYDIFSTIRDRTKHHVIISMIDDLRGSIHREALELIELFAYVENPEISSLAFDALVKSHSHHSIPLLRSIAELHSLYGEDARSAYIEKAEEGPQFGMRQREQRKGFDIRISLADGSGAFSVILGQRLRRNEYLFSNMIFKTSIGVKDVTLFTSLTRGSYEEMRDGYTRRMKLYRIGEDFFKKILRHFMHISIEKGFGVPAEIIALKNIFNWEDLDPGAFFFSESNVPEVPYRVTDVEKFPFDSWWIHDNSIYNLLLPHRECNLEEIPDDIFLEIIDRYVEYAKSELVPICDICAGIVLNAMPKKGTRLAGIFCSIKEEILNTPPNPMDSIFLSFQTMNTIHNTLHNLSLGVNSVEFL